MIIEKAIYDAESGLLTFSDSKGGVGTCEGIDRIEVMNEHLAELVITPFGASIHPVLPVNMTIEIRGPDRVAVIWEDCKP